MSKEEQAQVFTESDFSQFMLKETAEVFFKDPKGKPLLFNGKQASAIVSGPSTKRHRLAYTKRIQALAAMSRQVQGSEEEIDPEKQAEVSTKATIDFLIAVTHEFRNFPYPGGVSAILSKPEFKFFGDQILNLLDNEGNFFEGGQKG
jgi:hypothetical protein